MTDDREAMAATLALLGWRAYRESGTMSLDNNSEWVLMHPRDVAKSIGVFMPNSRDPRDNTPWDSTRTLPLPAYYEPVDMLDIPPDTFALIGAKALELS